MQKQVITTQVKRCNYYRGNLRARKTTLLEPQEPIITPLYFLLEKATSFIFIVFSRGVGLNNLAGHLQKWKICVTFKDSS